MHLGIPPPSRAQELALSARTIEHRWDRIPESVQGEVSPRQTGPFRAPLRHGPELQDVAKLGHEHLGQLRLHRLKLGKKPFELGEQRLSLALPDGLTHEAQKLDQFA